MNKNIIKIIALLMVTSFMKLLCIMKICTGIRGSSNTERDCLAVSFLKNAASRVG